MNFENFVHCICSLCSINPQVTLVNGEKPQYKIINFQLNKYGYLIHLWSYKGLISFSVPLSNLEKGEFTFQGKGFFPRLFLNKNEATASSKHCFHFQSEHSYHFQSEHNYHFQSKYNHHFQSKHNYHFQFKHNYHFQLNNYYFQF